MRGGALKDLTAEHAVAGIVARMEATLTLNGDHFNAWSEFTITAVFFSSGIGPRSRSFQRLTSHVIAFHYPRRINVIQFAC